MISASMTPDGKSWRLTENYAFTRTAALTEAIEQYLRRQRGHADEDWYRNVSARGDWDAIEITLRHSNKEALAA